MFAMRKFGVYSIENKTTGRDYIGSTTRSFKARWSDHRSLLRRGMHPCAPLQQDWRQYGEQVFEFCIVEIVSRIEDVRARELHYLALNRQYCTPLENYNVGTAEEAVLSEQSEIIAVIVARLAEGVSPSTVAKSLPGYSPRKYRKFIAKVNWVKQSLDR